MFSSACSDSHKGSVVVQLIETRATLFPSSQVQSLQISVPVLSSTYLSEIVGFKPIQTHLYKYHELVRKLTKAAWDAFSLRNCWGLDTISNPGTTRKNRPAIKGEGVTNKNHRVQQYNLSKELNQIIAFSKKINIMFLPQQGMTYIVRYADVSIDGASYKNNYTFRYMIQVMISN